MATTARAPSPATDAAELSRQWALGSLACNRGLIALLDAQTAWWKDTERSAARWMQPWVDTSAPLPSAQPLVDAFQAFPYPAFSSGLQQFWRSWALLWLNALQHDTGEP
ncbi:MAG: hypothetical protein HY020_25485 [Burkholderiales bacterium]|nr:hypothetical protein [Burkholderiales bacterium]